MSIFDTFLDTYSQMWLTILYVICPLLFIASAISILLLRKVKPGIMVSTIIAFIISLVLLIYLISTTAKVANGSACTRNSKCISGWCKDGLICSATSGVGETCASNGDNVSCSDDKYCGQEGIGTFTCCKSIAPSVGLEVRTDDWCAELEDGKGCKYDNQCNSGWCNNGICTAKAGVGEICGSNGDDYTCANNKVCGQYGEGEYRCCSNTAGGWIDDWCSELPIGSSCKHDNQCDSGWCSGGFCNTKGQVGEYCDSTGIDSTCADGKVCGQHGEGDYKCCSGTAAGWIDDWCN